MINVEQAPSNSAFRPDLLSLRRRMLNLSQTQLAESAQVGQGTLSKVEQGLLNATDDLIEKLAFALNCPVSFFYQPEREYGPPMSVHAMWRKKSSVGQKVIDGIIAELNIRIAHIRKFMSMVDFSPELPMPHYEVEDFNGEIEAIANNVRRAWLAPRGPLKSLTEYIERAGCLVVHCDLDAAKIDGVSYNISGLPPVIFLNKNQPADRMRFSLAHELGHIVMHSFPTPNMETEANQFASALLMPRDDIAPELNGISIEKAAYMKPVWKVSMAALIFRAKTLNQIDRYGSEYLWRQMSSRGFRLREPASLDFAPEKPSLMSALVNNLTENMGYSNSEFARTLHLHYEELSKLYELKPTQNLRLVK